MKFLIAFVAFALIATACVQAAGTTAKTGPTPDPITVAAGQVSQFINGFTGTPDQLKEAITSMIKSEPSAYPQSVVDKFVGAVCGQTKGSKITCPDFTTVVNTQMKANGKILP